MATADTGKLERLPLELWENIVEQLPVLDILELKQVNRGFRDLIRRSLRIQHKVDLYVTGLVPNLATGVTTVDSIKALGEYQSKWDKFDVDEEQILMRVPEGEHTWGAATAGGVHAVAMKHEIVFFTLPSNSRGIQSRKQTIPLDFRVTGFAFYPQADVVAVVGQTDRVMGLRLITMSEGLPHPSAHKKVVEYVTGPVSSSRGVSLSITGHRLASVMRKYDPEAFQLNVWDWRTGEQLFEYHSVHYQLVGFLDDYRLAIQATPPSHGLSPCLLLFDTEQVSSKGPVQTWFCGPTDFQRWFWMVEDGGHEPSPQDTMVAPFYPDPSQRILGVLVKIRDCLVMKVETFLELARERAGGEFQWEEWGPYLLKARMERKSYPIPFVRSWVSGSRLFRVALPQTGYTASLHVFDFSPRSRMKHFWRCPTGIMDPNVNEFHLFRGSTRMRNVSFGHDSVVYQLRRSLDSPEREDFSSTLYARTL